jgi:hypothetical protein
VPQVGLFVSQYDDHVAVFVAHVAAKEEVLIFFEQTPDLFLFARTNEPYT